VSPESCTCSASLRRRNIAGARTPLPPSPRGRAAKPRRFLPSPPPPPSPHPSRRGVSRDLAAIVYQWPQPHTRAARINIIISKSKAGGPRPVSALLSFSLPSPPPSAPPEARITPLRRFVPLPLFRSSIARSVSLCRIQRSARWMGSRLSPSALPFLLRAARARVASTHTRARCARATATYLDRASSTEGHRGSIARGSSTINDQEGDREGGRVASTHRAEARLFLALRPCNPEIR
jgi:hypothetical protein